MARLRLCNRSRKAAWTLDTAFSGKSCPGSLGTNNPHLSGRTTHQAYGPQELVIPSGLTACELFLRSLDLLHWGLGRRQVIADRISQRPLALPPMGCLSSATTSQSRLESKSVKVTLGGNRTNSRVWHCLAPASPFTILQAARD